MLPKYPITQKAALDFPIITTGLAVYSFGLVSGYSAIIWWFFYICWTAMVISRCYIVPINSSVLTWIFLFFVLPKRNPNADFITSLNQAFAGATVPLYELILFSIGLAIKVASQSLRTVVPGKGLYQNSIIIIMRGLCLAGISGLVKLVLSLDDDNQNIATVSHAASRCLRHLNEAIILSLYLRIRFDKDFIRSLSKILLFVGIVGALEVILWALPLGSVPIVRYLYDFRGGYRTICFGIGTGHMLVHVWVFILLFGLYINNYSITWIAALFGSIATFSSFHRTSFWTFSFVFLVASIIKIQMRLFLIIAVIIGVGGLVYRGDQFGGFGIIDEVSRAKGSDYFSLGSLRHRFELAESSFTVIADNPAFGVGPGLFAKSIGRLIQSGEASIDSRWVNTLEEEGGLSAVFSGEHIFDSHNIFVSLIVESGIFGWMIVFGYFILIYEGLLCFKGKKFQTIIFIAAWLSLVIAGLTQAEPYLFSHICLMFSIIRFEVISRPCMHTIKKEGSSLFPVEPRGLTATR
jgi:hypothetical protein